MRLIVIGRSRSGTTITRDIISSHPDIWLTNEVRLYEMVSGYHFKTTKDCFSKLRLRGGLKKLPAGVNGNLVAGKCLAVLKEDTVIGRIEAAEQVIFNNKYKIYGDKTGMSAALSFIYENGVPFKLIHIYRDGRDSVSSGKARSRGISSGIRWNTADVCDGSIDWANELNRWFKFRDSLPSDMYLDIRFEDYVRAPKKNLNLISDFLGIKNEFKNTFNVKSAHVGRYKEDIPNWQQEFCEEAKELLKKLGYI